MIHSFNCQIDYENKQFILSKKVAKFFNQGEFKKVLSALSDDVLEEKNDAELFALRARAHFMLEFDVDKIMHFAEKAIFSDPSYYMGYFTMALFWFEKNEPEKVIEECTRTINIEPNFADAYFYRGVAWQEKKEIEKANTDYDKAIENYEKSIASNPRVADVYLSIGIICYKKGNYYKAIDSYSRLYL